MRIINKTHDCELKTLSLILKNGLKLHYCVLVTACNWYIWDFLATQQTLENHIEKGDQNVVSFTFIRWSNALPVVILLYTKVFIIFTMSFQSIWILFWVLMMLIDHQYYRRLWMLLWIFRIWKSFGWNWQMLQSSWLLLQCSKLYILHWIFR